MCKLQTYDFDIEYVKNKNNVVVDTISRKPYLCSMSELSINWKVFIINEYVKNELTNEVLEGKIQDDRYKVMEDLIFYKGIIYLVLESKVKSKIMRVVHDAPLARHLGCYKTYKHVRDMLFWRTQK